MLLVGDAAGLVNPLSGEGIGYALASGVAAGLAVGAGDPAATYRQALRARFGPLWRQTAVAAKLLRHPALTDVLVTAAGRVPALGPIGYHLAVGEGVRWPPTAFTGAALPRTAPPSVG